MEFDTEDQVLSLFFFVFLFPFLLYMFLIELIATLVALQSVRKCSVAARLIMAGAVSVAVGRHSGKGVSESLFSKFFIFHFLPFLVRATSLYKSLFWRPSVLIFSRLLIGGKYKFYIVEEVIISR